MAKFEVPDYVAIDFFKSHVKGVRSSNVYRARCPICGDSRSRKHVKRLYLFKKKGNWRIFCHNCGYSSHFIGFVKYNYPSLYDDVKASCMEFVMNPEMQKKTKEQELHAIVKRLEKKNSAKKKQKDAEDTPIYQYLRDNCVKLSDSESCPDKSRRRGIREQIPYFEGRNVSQEFIDNLWYCYAGKYEDRVIIPFYNRLGNIYYFQAKAVYDHQDPKYINWIDDDFPEDFEQKPEYNEFHVDTDETVYIIEGLIDSLFVKNSVSTLGAKMSKSRVAYYAKKYPKRVFCLDNDPAGYEITKRLLEAGETCLLFPKECKSIKDLNELSQITGERDLTGFVKDYSFSGLDGIMKMDEFGIKLEKKRIYKEPSMLEELRKHGLYS